MGRPRPWRVPAIQAFIIQALALLPTAATVYFLSRWYGQLPVSGIALLQGAFAALVTRGCRLAAWWIPIQLLFPVALVGAHALHLPGIVLLGAFVALLLLFWSTFQTQVPFYPSNSAVWRAVAAVLPGDEPLRLIDIGSGLGGLVLELARRRPLSRCSGIEVAPLPWVLSVLRARLSGSTARFVRGDYERLDFADYDVVFAYLAPPVMNALWRKAQAEMRPATMLLSYEFSIPAKPPDKTIAVSPGRALYVWYF